MRKQRDIVQAQEQLREMATLSHNVNCLNLISSHLSWDSLGCS